LLGSCAPPGESFVEGRLGKSGAEALRAEAAAWLEAHATSPEPVERITTVCPSPRLVLDVYSADRAGGPAPRLEYSKLSKRATGASTISGVDDVRCLVLVEHDARGRKRSFKEWMIVRLVDRGAASEQTVRVTGNDEELQSFLASLP
jgi:hypothetical protein